MLNGNWLKALFHIGTRIQVFFIFIRFDYDFKVVVDMQDYYGKTLDSLSIKMQLSLHV
jgi:hypothetical protein